MEILEIVQQDRPENSNDDRGVNLNYRNKLAGYLVWVKSAISKRIKALSVLFFLLVVFSQLAVFLFLYDKWSHNTEYHLYIDGIMKGGIKAGPLLSIVIVATFVFWGAMVTLFKMYRAMIRQNEWEALTEDEREEIIWQLQKEENEKELFIAIHKQAKRFAKLIPEHMSIQNKVEYTYREDGKVRYRPKTVRIRFRAILCTHTEIWYVIDVRPGKLPPGTSTYSILDDKKHVAFNLTRGLHKHCSLHEDREWNLYIRVHLDNSKYGIPKKVKWEDCYHKLPKNNPLAVAIGVNEHNKMVYKDMRDWPHALVAGSTNQGKSVQLVQWIITLLKRNSSEDLKFIFVDFKEGVEFNKFADLPHTLAFVREPEDLQEQIEWLLEEYERRMNLFEGNCINIKGWNRKRHVNQKLPYIFMIVDELADIMDEKPLKKKAIPVIKRLARKGRAAGIHLIFATQIISSQVLEVSIRGNFPGRVCFAVPGVTESMMVVGNGAAARLEPQGRCVFLQGAKRLILQAPIASDKDIKQVIKEAKGEVEPEEKEVFGEMDLFRLIRDECNRKAGREDVWGVLNGRMGKDPSRNIIKNNEYDYTPDSIIVIDNEKNIITPNVPGYYPRMLIPINGYMPQLPEDIKPFIDSFINNEPMPTTGDCRPEDEAK